MKSRTEEERRFWNSFAGKYDRFISRTVSKSYAVMFESIDRDSKESRNALEIATGTGIIALHLAVRIPKITAIDIAPEMIRIAQEKAAAQSVGNIDFRIGDICDLKFPDRTFDLIIASNVLHLLFDPDKALQEMQRVLTTDGRIIVPTYCHGDSLQGRLLSNLMSLAGFRARTRWSVPSFQTFLAANGLKIINEQIIHDKVPLAYIIAVPIG